MMLYLTDINFLSNSWRPNDLERVGSQILDTTARYYVNLKRNQIITQSFYVELENVGHIHTEQDKN